MQKCETTNQTKSSQTSSFQKMHHSAPTALMDRPQMAKLAKPMCPSNQTLPPAFHKHLRSTCSCQHCPSPGEPRESWVSSSGGGAHGSGCQGPRKERGCLRICGLHTCPSRFLCCPLHRCLHAGSVPGEQSDPRKGLSSGLDSGHLSYLQWQALPLLHRGPLESAVCNEVIVWDGFHNTGGGKGGDGRRGPELKLFEADRWVHGDSLHYPLYCHILRGSIRNSKKLKIK